MDHVITEVIKIELHPNNMNREDGFCLSRSWKLLIHSLSNCRKSPEHYNGLRSPWGYMGLHMLNTPRPRPSPPHLVCYLLGSSLTSPLVYYLPPDFTCLPKLVLLHFYNFSLIILYCFFHLYF
jgi:hypothetical protein